MFDFEHSTEEDRYIAIGKVGEELSPAMMKAFRSSVIQIYNLYILHIL